MSHGEKVVRKVDLEHLPITASESGVYASQTLQTVTSTSSGPVCVLLRYDDRERKNSVVPQGPWDAAAMEPLELYSRRFWSFIGQVVAVLTKPVCEFQRTCHSATFEPGPAVNQIFTHFPCL